MRTCKEKKKRKFQVLMLVILLLFMQTMGVMAADNNWTTSGGDSAYTIRYTKGKLTWENVQKVEGNGAAVWNAFDSVYDNVESQNGDAIIAPGTEKTTTIRLKNDVVGSVKYTAVLYQTGGDAAGMFECGISGKYAEVSDYSLPDGVDAAQVVEVIRGTLKGGEAKAFDVEWSWPFEDDEQRDQIDTLLGDSADDLENATGLGFYVVVEDSNTYIEPSVPSAPRTGDENDICLLIAGVAISLCLIAIIYRRKKGDE